MKFRWKWWNAVRVDDKGAQSIAECAVRSLEKKTTGVSFCMSGDCLVMAHYEDGKVEVIECTIRRTGNVTP